MNIRVLKILVVLMLAMWCFLTFLENVFSYQVHREQIVSIMLMENIPQHYLEIRPLVRSLSADFALWAIMLGKLSAAVYFALGVKKMFSALKAPAQIFDEAKRYVVKGTILICAMLFTVFFIFADIVYMIWMQGVEAAMVQQYAFMYIVSIAIFTLLVLFPEISSGGQEERASE